jgi:hypothetical protein
MGKELVITIKLEDIEGDWERVSPRVVAEKVLLDEGDPPDFQAHYENVQTI